MIDRRRPRHRYQSTRIDLGFGYRVTISFHVGKVLCEWEPDVPGPQTPPAVVDRYRLAMQGCILGRMMRYTGDVEIRT